MSAIIAIMQEWKNIRENKFPWKAWLFKCLYILNMTSNSLEMRPDFYATYLCSPIYQNSTVSLSILLYFIRALFQFTIALLELSRSKLCIFFHCQILWYSINLSNELSVLNEKIFSLLFLWEGNDCHDNIQFFS